MKNNSNVSSSRQAKIKTKHVFSEDEQVFLKKEPLEYSAPYSEVAEWFPTDFNWVSARL